MSAYHSYHGVQHDAVEDHPTSYVLWNETHRYHMDFVFVPADSHIRSTEIGTFDNYLGRGLSDHVLVVASIGLG